MAVLAPKRRHNLGWLIGYTLASMATSFLVVKIFDWLVAGVTDGLVSIARPGLFVVTWTVITAKAGMSGFTRRIQGLRKGIGIR